MRLDFADHANKLTEQIVGSAYIVGNSLGHGFLEKVYENALIHELKKSGLNTESQKGLQVFYDGLIVGHYVADLIVEACILVELKAVKAIEDVHVAQCLNYLKATGLKIGLLINFGPSKVDLKRIVNNF